jgi:protoporphyrinogen oxidase
LPGGLAVGFKNSAWDWSLEHHYHHIFTSDKDIIALGRELGVEFKFYRPNTSSLVGANILQLDSPLKLLQFEKLSIWERLRMGAVLFYLKFLGNFKYLEKFETHDFLRKTMGEKAYKMLWEPLLMSKFGPFYKEIALSWFYARIKARTTKLGYPDNGFMNLAKRLAQEVVRLNGHIEYESKVTKITMEDGYPVIYYGDKAKQFDKVIFTGPNFLFASLAPQLSESYKKQLLDFKGIGALNIVLELDKPFFRDNVYWLSVCNKDYPFLAVVEHTNFISKEHYNNKHIVYIGNYLQKEHEFFKKGKDELLNIYKPYLKKINPDYEKNIINSYMFSVPFAQPIVNKNFSKKIMPHKTPLSGVFLANMQQVYPWDRGTNFAVAMGNDVSELVLHD